MAGRLGIMEPMTVTAVRGTALGAATSVSSRIRTSATAFAATTTFVPIPRDQWVKRPLEDIVDAVLYVGPASGRTSAGISPTLWLTPPISRCGSTESPCSTWQKPIKSNAIAA